MSAETTDLFAKGIPDLKSEDWLAKRVTQLLAAVFSGDTDLETRKARFRRAIAAGGLEGAIAGKNAVGKTETVQDLFERIYGEKLNLPAPKTRAVKG